MNRRITITSRNRLKRCSLNTLFWVAKNKRWIPMDFCRLTYAASDPGPSAATKMILVITIENIWPIWLTWLVTSQYVLRNAPSGWHGLCRNWTAKLAVWLQLNIWYARPLFVGKLLVLTSKSPLPPWQQTWNLLQCKLRNFGGHSQPERRYAQSKGE